MRDPLLTLFCLLFSTSISAQYIMGIVTDVNGKSIEYVNIGVANTAIGIVSDGMGRFSFEIPDSLSGHDLIVSHVSFDPLTVPVRDIQTRISSGDPLVFRLAERSIPIKEVLVFSGKGKYKRVGSSHLKALRNVCLAAKPRAGAICEEEMRMYGNRIDPAGFHAEAISILNIKQPMLIREVSFPVVGMTYDSVLVRLNLYAQEDGVFSHIHSRPIYSMIPYTAETTYYDVDILEDEITVYPGNLYVGFEVVRYYGFKPERALLLPFHWGGGYFRSGVNHFEKQFMHPGMQIYGRILPD